MARDDPLLPQQHRDVVTEPFLQVPARAYVDLVERDRLGLARPRHHRLHGVAQVAARASEQCELDGVGSFGLRRATSPWLFRAVRASPVIPGEVHPAAC